MSKLIADNYEAIAAAQKRLNEEMLSDVVAAHLSVTIVHPGSGYKEGDYDGKAQYVREPKRIVEELFSPGEFGKSTAERDEFYGRSPAMDALPALKAWNDLPPEERARCSARFVEWRPGYGTLENPTRCITPLEIAEAALERLSSELPVPNHSALCVLNERLAHAKLAEAEKDDPADLWSKIHRMYGFLTGLGLTYRDVMRIEYGELGEAELQLLRLRAKGWPMPENAPAVLDAMVKAYDEVPIGSRRFTVQGRRTCMMAAIEAMMKEINPPLYTSSGSLPKGLNSLDRTELQLDD